jgi:hypothetical protein
MVNSGKRKYTKKKIMSGGENDYILRALYPNGRQNKSNEFIINGSTNLSFIDGTQDSFQNIYNKLAGFIKTFPYSKCYLVSQGSKLIPYQLVYENENVYQYAAYDKNIKRLVIPPTPKAHIISGWAANTHGSYPGYTHPGFKS